MSEIKMFGIAFSSTFAMSLIAAGILFFLAAEDLAVLVGATLAGAATYVAICMFCLPYVRKPVVEPFEESEEYV
ncbi:MAG: hypothetical protein DKT66_06105 [Candidatus Melainabacteria bacterium]|nr:MAG: hypothetical protein DKT66_06105 [Candidatus Melainabacteria bacterium]